MMMHGKGVHTPLRIPGDGFWRSPVWSGTCYTLAFVAHIPLVYILSLWFFKN